MSLYAKYVNERLGKEVVETETGFATFQITGTDCYIEDIFVVSDARKTGEASRIANEITSIAKAQGCKRLLGSVVPSANGSTDSCKVLLAYGFRLLSSANNFIVFVKDL